MTRKLKASKSLHVTQHLIQHNTKPSQIFAKLSEQLYYEFPDRFRADSFSDVARQIHIVSGSRVLTVLDGHASEGPELPVDRYKDVLLFRSRILLHKQLLRLGIDVSITSMGRYNEQPVYVIGSQFPNESVSQLWLEKETFLPIRMLLVEKASVFFFSDSKLEIRYEDWKEIEKIWYPMRIEIYGNEQLMREIWVQNVYVDAAIPPDLMDIDTVKLQFLTEVKRFPDSTDGSEDLTDVQKTIVDFKKKFE